MPQALCLNQAGCTCLGDGSGARGLLLGDRALGKKRPSGLGWRCESSHWKVHLDWWRWAEVQN